MLISINKLIQGVAYVIYNNTECKELYRGLAASVPDAPEINIDRQCLQLMWKCNFVNIPFTEVGTCAKSDK